MSWSARYLQKKFPEHTGVEEPSKPSKPPLEGLEGIQPPVRVQEKSAPTGEAPCPTCGCGSFWRGESSAWRCERYTPPGNAHVASWRNIGGGKVPPMPPPAMAWPPDLDAMLRRVSEHFEWTRQDIADFRQWAQRSPAGLADARVFLAAECDKLDLALYRMNEPRRPDAANTEGGNE